MQARLHVKEPLLLFIGQLRHRDAGEFCDNFRNLRHRHMRRNRTHTLLPCICRAAERLLLRGNLAAELMGPGRTAYATRHSPVRGAVA